MLLACLINRQDVIFMFSVGEVHSDSTVSVVCLDIAGTLKKKIGVALPASASQPPKIRFGGAKYEKQ